MREIASWEFLMSSKFGIAKRIGDQASGRDLRLEVNEGLGELVGGINDDGKED